MIRDHFRVLRVELPSGKGEILTLDGRDVYAGGSGLAALLFSKFGRPDKRWDGIEQPLIFAIGPLTGLFPLMSKTVCAFKSPYHDQFAESHGGGRSALALRLADLDALVITGKARTLSCLWIGSRGIELRDVRFMKGFDIHATGKLFRRMFPGAGHPQIIDTIAGEHLFTQEEITVADEKRNLHALLREAPKSIQHLLGVTHYLPVVRPVIKKITQDIKVSAVKCNRLQKRKEEMLLFYIIPFQMNIGNKITLFLHDVRAHK